MRQGCLLSPTLFDVYSEFIANEALEEIQERVKTTRKNSVKNGTIIKLHNKKVWNENEHC